jgi:hypothetical protein
MKELAEWFGLELARIVVDECQANLICEIAKAKLDLEATRAR